MTAVEIQLEPVLIWTGRTMLNGLLEVPHEAKGVVMIANGVGRFTHPVAQRFASRLHESGFGTLMFDVLTPDEQQFDSRTSHYSRDVKFQGERLRGIAQWIHAHAGMRSLPVACVAAGAAARGLLHLAAEDPRLLDAIVISGCHLRPADVPSALTVPALVIAEDQPAQVLYARQVADALAGPHRVEIISSAEVSAVTDAFLSDSGGSVTARWLRDVFLLSRMELDD